MGDIFLGKQPLHAARAGSEEGKPVEEAGVLVLGKVTLMLSLSEGLGVHKWEFVQSRQVFGS